MSHAGQSIFSVVCGVCFGTNGSVVLKPPIQTELFASQGGGSVSIYSLSHMPSLCVRVNFLTGQSKTLSIFALVPQIVLYFE